MMELLYENSQELEAVKFFRKKAVSYMFQRVLIALC